MKRPYQILPRPNQGVDQDCPLLASVVNVDQVLGQLELLKRFESSLCYQRQDYLAHYYDSSETSASTSASEDEGLWSFWMTPLRKNSSANATSRDAIVDADYRAYLCSLLYEIADFCHFRRETVALAMCSIFDRYLSSSIATTAATTATTATVSSRDEIRLAALTSLLIATKLLEPVNIEIHSLADLASGPYHNSVQSLLEMERTILTTLHWNVAHCPTPMAFVQQYVALLCAEGSPLDVAESILEQAQYQVELAVLDYDLVVLMDNALPSQVALAAVWNALENSRMIPAGQLWYQERLLDILSSCIVGFDENNDNDKIVPRKLSDIQLQLCDLLYHHTKDEDEEDAEDAPPPTSSSRTKNGGKRVCNSSDMQQDYSYVEDSTENSSISSTSSLYDEDFMSPSERNIVSRDVCPKEDAIREATKAKTATNDSFYNLSFFRKLLSG